MAVKTSWSAGDVLTAADLTDTFAAKANYPAGGTNGQALVKSGTTTAWANAGALTLVGSSDPSAASSAVFNNIFSAGKRHIIVADLTGSANTNLAIRMRASGTDATTAYYGGVGLIDINNGNYAAYRTLANQAQMSLWDISSSSYHSYFIELGQAADTQPTKMWTNYENADGTPIFGGGAHRTATAYDGVTLYPLTGSFTGKIRIYSYSLA